MKFIVMGASGFVGGEILSHVRSRGFEAVGTQSGSESEGLMAFDLLHHRITQVMDPAFLETDQPVYGVICAAVCQTDRCYEEKALSCKVNVENTIRLVQDCRALGIRPIFISSSVVFDGTVGHCSEESPHSPISEYGRHKAAVEDFMRSTAPETLVLRLDRVVGDGLSERNLFFQWLQRIRSKTPLTCIEGQNSNPTFVQDIARAIVLSSELELTGLYNVANTEVFSLEDLAKLFTSMLSTDAEIISQPLKTFGFSDLRPLKSHLDAAKFQERTGFRFTPVREVLKRFLRNVQSEPAVVTDEIHGEN